MKYCVSKSHLEDNRRNIIFFFFYLQQEKRSSDRIETNDGFRWKIRRQTTTTTTKEANLWSNDRFLFSFFLHFPGRLKKRERETSFSPPFASAVTKINSFFSSFLFSSFLLFNLYNTKLVFLRKKRLRDRVPDFLDLFLIIPFTNK